MPRKRQSPVIDDATAASKAQASHSARVHAARDDAATFCELVMRDEFTGRPIVLAPCHEEWHDICSEHDRVVLWGFLESGKTSQISVGRLMWELGRNPNLRGAVVSNTQRQAEKIVGYIGKYIQSSPEVHAVFPDLRPGTPWTQAQLTVQRPRVSKDPTIQALGLHGNIVGARLDFVLIDDILDFENTQSAHHREDTWGWYHAALSGRLTKAAWVRVLGNAWHHDDLMFRLARMPGWTARACPVLDAEGISAWPDRWSLERIAAKRMDLTPFEFARQMMCQPRTQADSKFQEAWIRTCMANGDGLTPVHSLDELLNDPQWVHELTGITLEELRASEEARLAGDAAMRLAADAEKPRFRIFTGVDLAVGRESGHETVFFTVAQCHDGRRRPLEVLAGRWPGPEIVTRLVDVYDRFGGVMVVEDNACFPPGARVMTVGGYRPIEQVGAGDVVLTHRGRWRPVVRRTSRVYDGDLIRVRPSGGLPVYATETHAFWVRESGRVPGSRTTSDVGKHRPIGDPGWQSACGLRAGVAAHYAATPIPRWPVRRAEIELHRYSTRRTIDVDESLAVVLGLYLAEGSIAARDQVRFTTHARETHLRAFVRAVVSTTFGANGAERDGEGACTHLSVNSSELRSIVSEFGKSAGKALPWTMMGWPLPLRLAIIRGWLMGDGCIRWNNVRSPWLQQMLSGVTISRDLAAQVRYTLLEAGMRPTISVREPRPGMINGRIIHWCHPMFNIALNADDTAALLGMATLDVERQHWAKYETRVRLQESNSRIVLDGPTAWSRLLDLERVPYTGPVYNLVVADDESYVVEDVAVHNSQAFLIQFARERDCTVPIIPFTTGAAKMHPEMGVEGLAAEFAAGKWAIPNIGGKAEPEFDKWIRDLLFYDPHDHTPDRIMASWFVREIIRRSERRPASVGVRVIG